MIHTSSKHILIAEDDPSISDVLTIILEDAGFTIYKPHSYDEIINQWQGQTFDLILLDLMLWGKSGADICRKIKAAHRSKDTPVLLISARHDAKNIAADAGADGIIQKPFDVDMLISKVREYVK